MWLYHTSLSARASGYSTSQLRSLNPNLRLPVTSKGTATVQPLSWRGWANRPWIELLSGVILNPFQVLNLKEPGCSSGASPVNPTPPPVSSSGLTTTDASGTPPGKSCETSEPRDSSLRTQLTSSDIRMDCSEPWKELPNWGSMRNGECSVASNWEPRTPESDCTYWPTPTASSYGYNKGGAAGRVGKERHSLESLGRMWATPKVPRGGPERMDTRKARGAGGVDLITQAADWSTPKAKDWKNGGGNRKSPDLNTQSQDWSTPLARNWKKAGGKARNSDDLCAQAESFPSGPQDKKQNSGQTGLSTCGRRLNVLFVEKLMGAPLGWSQPNPIEPTSYAVWEMQCRLSKQSLLGQC